MANLITVNTFSSLSQAVNGQANATTASPVIINVHKIISVKTRAVPYLTTGVTDVIYEYPVNQANLQVQLVCTETATVILGLANAALVSA